MLSNLDELINFSKHLADESEKIIKNYFRTSLNIESKEDKSPVTLADKEVELKIRDLQKSYNTTRKNLEEDEGLLLKLRRLADKTVNEDLTTTKNTPEK